MDRDTEDLIAKTHVMEKTALRMEASAEIDRLKGEFADLMRAVYRHTNVTTRELIMDAYEAMQAERRDLRNRQEK